MHWNCRRIVKKTVLTIEKIFMNFWLVWTIPRQFICRSDPVILNVFVLSTFTFQKKCFCVMLMQKCLYFFRTLSDITSLWNVRTVVVFHVTSMLCIKQNFCVYKYFFKKSDKLYWGGISLGFTPYNLVQCYQLFYVPKSSDFFSHLRLGSWLRSGCNQFGSVFQPYRLQIH